jgi:cell wall-associated NlpC family hydrolase
VAKKSDSHFRRNAFGKRLKGTKKTQRICSSFPNFDPIIFYMTFVRKSPYYFILFLLLFAFACSTPHKAKKHEKVNEHRHVEATGVEKKVIEKSDFYSNYSKKLGVKLQGTEDKKLITCMASWLGTPYKYSGETRQGTDCSGMVLAIYKEVYKKDLFRSSMEQMKNVTLIKRDELKLGDLVFFKIGSDNVSHVGIYIGESKFMHASTQRGVVINSLEEEYYKKWFFMGGRVAVN